MKFLLLTIVIGILSYIAEQYLPWWSVVMASFLAALFIYTRSLNAFLAGFLGVGLLWFIFALSIDISTDSILTEKIAILFKMGQPLLLVVTTGFIGGIAGGLGALTGNQLLKIFTKKESRYKFN